MVEPADPFPFTAKTDSCLSSAWLEQAGQAGLCSPWTRVSKACRQSRQTYSKIGIWWSVASRASELGPRASAGTSDLVPRRVTRTSCFGRSGE